MYGRVNSIDELRAQIDRLDDELIGLLAKRVDACCSIGAIKSDAGVPVMQEDRVHTVKERCAARAEELMLDPSFVVHLYGLIIEHACELETAMDRNAPEPI